MNSTTFEYLYRDASNFKAWGGVLLRGTLSDALKQRLVEKFESGAFFIAEQIGIPPVRAKLWERSDRGPTDDDHEWHELSEFRPSTERDLEDFRQWGSVDDFMTRVMAIEDWSPDPLRQEGNLSSNA